MTHRNTVQKKYTGLSVKDKCFIYTKNGSSWLHMQHEVIGTAIGWSARATGSLLGCTQIHFVPENSATDTQMLSLENVTLLTHCFTLKAIFIPPQHSEHSFMSGITESHPSY